MSIKLRDLKIAEFYWLKLSTASDLIIGKWHGTGFWIAGNDLPLCQDDGDGPIKIVAHIPRPPPKPMMREEVAAHLRAHFGHEPPESLVNGWFDIVNGIYPDWIGKPLP